MATDHNHHQAQHSDVAFEHSDLGHRGIWAFFIFLGVSTAVIFIAIGALYKGFGYAQAKLAPESNPMAVSQAMPVATEMQNTASVDIQKFSANGTQPVLQFNDTADMETFRKQEELTLNAGPWKDESGAIHLPIAHAMQLVSQRNQPARSNGSNPALHDPNTVPTEAGFVGQATVQQQADPSAAEGEAHTEHQATPDEVGKKPQSLEQNLKTPAPTAKVPKK
jgi:hypothetical protein